MSAPLIDLASAKGIAQDHLGKPPAGSEYEYVMLDEHTHERPTCFVFVYQSSRFLETGDIGDMLAGSALLVDRRTGASQPLWSSRTIESQIEEFERQG